MDDRVESDCRLEFVGLDIAGLDIGGVGIA